MTQDTGIKFSITAQTSRSYKDNKMCHTLCIHSDQSVCATDHVINMKLLIELDETQIWQGSNVHNWDNENKKVPKIAKEVLKQLEKAKDPILLSHFKNLKQNPQGMAWNYGTASTNVDALNQALAVGYAGGLVYTPNPYNHVITNLVG